MRLYHLLFCLFQGAAPIVLEKLQTACADEPKFVEQQLSLLPQSSIDQIGEEATHSGRSSRGKEMTNLRKEGALLMYMYL